MIDLRTLSIEQRRDLCIEVERQARAGVPPPEIRAQLGITKNAYARWAKLFGFRQCDLFPSRRSACAPPKHAPGPGGYAYSGRRFRGIGPGPEDGRLVSGPDHPAWRGGEVAWRSRDLDKRTAKRSAAAEEVDRLGTPGAVLEVVEDAMSAGDLARADRLLAAWKASTRRTRALKELKQLAYEAREFRPREEWTDEELCADLSRLVGRKLTLDTSG